MKTFYKGKFEKRCNYKGWIYFYSLNTDSNMIDYFDKESN